MRTISLVLVLAAFSGLGLGGGPRAWAAPATAGQIHKWIDDLDSDRFLTREVATANLIAAGQATIEPVTTAISRGSVEVAMRAVLVLRDLATSENAATADAAEDALRKITRARITVASARAQAALDALAEVRQQRAIGILQGLGAKIDRRDIAFGLQAGEEVVSIQLDDDWRGSAADLKFLGHLADARQLTLVGPKITNEVLVQAEKLSNLNVVMLKRTGISEAGLAPLRALPNLIQVSIFYSPLGDGVVDHLAAIKSAKLVRLYGTRLSREGQARLENQLVGAKIDVRRGGFLGLGPALNGFNDGFIVGHVVPDSAADKAGIEEGDTLVQFDGKKVKDFEGLTTLIANHIPGDKVPVLVERDGETFSKEVTLGEWEITRLNP